jgi:hypothetical protein
MEQAQPETNTRVQITQAVFDGLEFIRRSGATNMLDRPMVLRLAREWDFTATADWIARVDMATYARLIFQGPDVIADDLTAQESAHAPGDRDSELTPADQVDEDDAMSETDENDVIELALDNVRRTMHDFITTLGKHAILTLADTYDTEQMGVLFAPSRRDVITAERTALIRNLGHASSLWLQLEKSMIEVQRGIGSLQYLTDPDNN